MSQDNNEYYQYEFGDETEEQQNIVPWKLIIADDDVEVHRLTKAVLRDIRFENRPLTFLSAYSGQEAETMLVAHPDTALLLLDVVMGDDHTGMQVVRNVREQLGNTLVRIVLCTGQPDQAPEQDVIVKYDINDYKEKTDLTEQRLLSTLITSLRAYRDLLALDAAKRAAERADKAKTVFLNTMTHEFRTPMNAILGYAQILAMDAQEGVAGRPVATAQKRLENATEIYKAGVGLHEILTDIMDVAQIQYQNVCNQSQEFILTALLEQVIEETKPLFGTNKNRLKLEVDPDLGNMTTDAKKLQRVLYHLLSNAAKFSPNGDTRFRVTKEADDAWLCFTVFDTGPGIGPENLERIFEPFTQIDGSLTRPFAGAGMGLTISKYFSAHLGGTLSVVTEPGKGSAFTARIPRRAALVL